MAAQDAHQRRQHTSDQGVGKTGAEGRVVNDHFALAHHHRYFTPLKVADIGNERALQPDGAGVLFGHGGREGRNCGRPYGGSSGSRQDQESAATGISHISPF